MTEPQTVTPADIEAAIKHEHFFTAYEGVLGERFNHEGPGDNDKNEGTIPASLRLMTICVLTMQNGFIVVGTSACADPLKYNKEIGQRIAKEKAEEQIWMVLGYELRNSLYQQASAPGQRAAGERQPEGHDAVGTGPAEESLEHELQNISVSRETISGLGDMSGSTLDPFSKDEDK